jgi:hypothetical protein
MTGTFTLSPISNGSVNLPMWAVNNSNGNLESYSGNDTASSVSITISSNATMTMGGSGSSSIIGTIVFTNVAFSSGGAARAWSAGQYAAQ